MLAQSTRVVIMCIVVASASLSTDIRAVGDTAVASFKEVTVADQRQQFAVA